MRSSLSRRFFFPVSPLASLVGGGAVAVCTVVSIAGCSGDEGDPTVTMPSLGGMPSGAPTGTGPSAGQTGASGPSGPIAPTTGPSGPSGLSGPSGPSGTVNPQPSPVQPTTTAPVSPSPSGSTTQTTDTAGPSSQPVSPTGETPTQEPPDVDQAGKPNASPGSMSDVPQDYLRLGEIRILNNNWGSEDLGCTAPKSTMSVFVSQDRSFGWNFNRGDCAAPTDSSHPDFPQVEFGIHPFGIGSHLVTSPEFSSTTLLPLQISAIQSASVTVDNLTINLQNQDSWNITFEFWLSEEDPRQPNAKVYAELMTWWGWDAGRWPCGDNGMTYSDRVSAGSLDYTLCHQNDNWADGWRYYQFRAGDGSDGNIKRDFNGKVDVKALLDYLVNQRGYRTDLWVTRLEVGSEIDDNTSGTVSMRGITFEVNGQSRSQVIATP